jgi:hypothetical protein
MPNVTLGYFANVPITAASGVYRLKFVGGSSRTVDLMNLGPGAVFIRSDGDPTVNDANSLQLPANWAANKITVDGANGLNIIAAADTTLSLRAS